MGSPFVPLQYDLELTLRNSSQGDDAQLSPPKDLAPLRCHVSGHLGGRLFLTLRYDGDEGEELPWLRLNSHRHHIHISTAWIRTAALPAANATPAPSLGHHHSTLSITKSRPTRVKGSLFLGGVEVLTDAGVWQESEDVVRLVFPEPLRPKVGSIFRLSVIYHLQANLDSNGGGLFWVST